MPEQPARPAAAPPRAATPASAQSQVDPPTLCDRCGAEMFRMHAVWRCPTCGYKTDCCGW